MDIEIMDLSMDVSDLSNMVAYYYKHKLKLNVESVDLYAIQTITEGWNKKKKKHMKLKNEIKHSMDLTPVFKGVETKIEVVLAVDPEANKKKA